MKDQRLAIFTGGLFADHHAKTAHGVIRYGSREVVAVIDDAHAGQTAADVVAFCDRPVPIVGSLDAAIALGANRLLVGVAPTGGKLDPLWRKQLLDAIAMGLDIEAGMHTLLAEDPELCNAASAAGVELCDLRLAPQDLDVPQRSGRRRQGACVVHSVGTDVAIGKKTVTLELARAARSAGKSAVFVPTGQTGIAIAGWGIAVDHVLSDYVAGAGERLVTEGLDRGDLLFIEGQGALFHPAYSGVTLGLLHGCAPDVLVLCHLAGARSIRGYPEVELASLAELVRAYELVARPIHPARVAAISLVTADLDEAKARAAIAAAQDETGLVCDDPVRFGAQRILKATLELCS